MKFLDLNTGCTFDGLWLDGQINGYTFWFPNEQSTRLTYTMPICIYCDTNEPLLLEIDDNDIFSFISTDTEQTLNGFEFKNPIYSFTQSSECEAIANGYIHKFYVACKSDIAGEFTTFINIKGHGKIKIGADFYGEYESVYINLSNFGVEIPDYVQKAIYDSNVHEDYKDNILLNRKMKELLSNYWDLIANRGSYKSLFNTLSWFEWGDILRIREIWKRQSAGKTIYDDRELMSLLENKYEDSLGNFVKTTYFSLYANLYKITEQYDNEDNPILESIALKWGKEDLALKLSLLAQFFSTFFMPIHTSLLHACVEDVVYTNTIKNVCSADICRTDTFGDWNYIDCNIKDYSEFRISNIRAQVSENTVYQTNYLDYVKKSDNNEPVLDENGNMLFDNIITFGVDTFTSNGNISDNTLANFAAQYYTGPGAIIPIEFTLNNQEYKDYIKYTSVDFIPDGYNERKKLVFTDRFKVTNGKIYIKFNILVKEARDYILDFMFITASSKTLTRRVILKVKDTDNLHIQLYKVQAKDDTNGFTYDDWNDIKYNDYFFRIQPQKSDKYYYSQYLQYMPDNHEQYNNYNGIKLTRTVIIDMMNKNGHGKVYTKDEINKLRARMNNDFLEFDKTDENGNLTYTIWVSKYFNAKVPEKIIADKYNIIRNSLGFYPQFHKLIALDGTMLNDYTINQYEAVCCAAEIRNTSRKEPIPFRYGHLIEDAEWTFVNSSTHEKFEHDASVQTPFIASKTNTGLPDGYYDVIFRYKLVDSEPRELILNSAFRKKSI
jgi:hypothetical protein